MSIIPSIRSARSRTRKATKHPFNIIPSANGRVIARNMFGFHDRKTWGNADTIRTRGGLMYYQYDALGNVTDFTDHLGDNVVKYRWDAFGGMFAGVLAPYSRMGITGKEYDPKTGQVFFGSRWYNPMVGQFTMPDTFMGQINKPQSLNAYAYAWNNPVNRTDPTGHWIDNGNGTYTAESGDTLWGLAQQTTGDGSNWTNLGYTGTPENLQVGETVGSSSGGTSSGGTSSGDTSSGDTTSGGTPSGNDNGGSSSGGGGSSGGGSYTPPPPPPEGGSISLPVVSNDSSNITQVGYDITPQGTSNADPTKGMSNGNTTFKVASLAYAPSITLPSFGEIVSGAASIASKALGIGVGTLLDILINAEPTSDEDWDPDKARERGLPPDGITPPGYGSDWTNGDASRPSEVEKGGKSTYDPSGGEWRYSPEDKYHNPHWDYNPHSAPNSPWENVPLNPGDKIYK